MNVITQPYRRPPNPDTDNFRVTMSPDYDLWAAVDTAGVEVDLSSFLEAHPSGRAPIWALGNNRVGPPIWRKMASDDLVIFHGNNEIYASGFVSAKVHWPNNNHVWPTGRDWDWIYSLRDVHLIPDDERRPTTLLRDVLPSFNRQRAQLHNLDALGLTRLASAIGIDQTPPPPRMPARGPDRVRWVTDSPATSPTTDDALRRAPLAKALARRLLLQDESLGRSFLVHLDGEWGAGKTSFMNFLKAELERDAGLERDWLVVTFNAWRQSRIGPPWWSLLTALRRAMHHRLRYPARVRLRILEASSRLRHGGGVYILALFLVVLVAVGIYLVARPERLGVSSIGDLAKVLTAVLTAVSALWVGAVVASRFLFWDSPRGARAYETSNTNPRDGIAEHFAWLTSRCNRPVVFAIDDLDRCSPDYVVELIESMQTLVRDAPGGVGGRSSASGCHFVVAADGAWIRRSFECRYAEFSQSLTEPGRPLGYLFLDKVFQLSVAVPAISDPVRDDYLRSLLRVDPRKVQELVEENRKVRERIGSSTTDKEIIEALKSATPSVRDAVTPIAVERLNSPEVDSTREHFLQQFACLLAPNPRSMKRFVIANSMALTELTVQGRSVPTETLALWLVVQTRWPALAELLRKQPESVSLFVKREGPEPDSIPDNLRLLLESDDVREVLTFSPGGPLTAELIRQTSGRVEVSLGSRSY